MAVFWLENRIAMKNTLFHFCLLFVAFRNVALYGQTTAALLSVPPGGILTNLVFSDSLHGFAAGREGRILKSTDGGNSWFSVISGSIANINGLAAANAQEIFASTETGQVLISADSGETWAAISVSTEPLNKAFWHAGKLFVLGRNGNLFINPHLDTGNLTISIAGNWANLDQMFWTGDQTGFIVADSSHAFASNSVLFRTTDGGNTWNRQIRIQSTEGSPSDTIFRNFSWKNLHHIIRKPDSSLLMCGGYYPGFIWKSTDGGATFYLKSEIVQVNPQQIEAIDESRIALISWEGDALQPYIARNRNGGSSWHQWINDTSLFRLPAPFKPTGKAVFRGNGEVLIPGYLQNSNGNTGAIMRVRNIFPELLTDMPEVETRPKQVLYPVPAGNALWIGGIGAHENFQVLNALGQKVAVPYSRQGADFRLDLRQLPEGLYRVFFPGKALPFLVGERP
jgi:photosystem II stability/assembly factor-like uncharacterized protein